MKWTQLVWPGDWGHRSTAALTYQNTVCKCKSNWMASRQSETGTVGHLRSRLLCLASPQLNSKIWPEISWLHEFFWFVMLCCFKTLHYWNNSLLIILISIGQQKNGQHFLMNCSNWLVTHTMKQSFQTMFGLNIIAFSSFRKQKFFCRSFETSNEKIGINTSFWDSVCLV